MTIAAIPILVDVTEAAEMLSVRPEQIRLWLKDGSMPRPVNLNGNRRFLVRDLERWAEANRFQTLTEQPHGPEGNVTCRVDKPTLNPKV